MISDARRISILIPCYNKAEHISRVVESAFDQTHPPEEVIVVDDASTDHSVKILNQLPIRLICHETNRGPAIARNTALQEASGDIVIFIDSDAYADRHMIEMLLAAYDHPRSRTLGGVGGRGIETNLSTVYDRWRDTHARQDFGLTMRDNVPYLFGLCMSFKRSVINDIGRFDPFYPINAGEDLDIGFRLNRAGYWLRYTPKAIVYHQHRDTEENLKRVQYNWYYWSYLAKKRTRNHPWTLVVGTLRRLFVDTLNDLILRRNKEFVRLDLQMFLIKIQALRDAAFST